MKKSEVVQERKTSKGIIKGIGSVLLAVIASSHHWVHTLLLALGLTTLSSSLISLSPPTKVIFLIFVVGLIPRCLQRKGFFSADTPQLAAGSFIGFPRCFSVEAIDGYFKL